MAHYYATIQGARGPKTATGSKNSSIKTAAQTFDGSVIVEIDHIGGVDRVTISTAPGSSTRPHTVLWAGPLSDLMDAQGLALAD